MDLIIQLIIIVVIVASIMKRMQEVAKKGKELEEPPPVSPPAEPQMVKRLQDVFKELSDDRTGQEVMEKEPVTEIRDFRERQPEFAEPVVEEVPLVPEEGFCPVSEDIIQPVSYRKFDISKVKQKQGLQLSFKGPEVVRGIIMSEVLGPPVSMR